MGRLFVIPTPIGNLKDITFRAIELLNFVDYILAEDTRKTSILLKHYKISKKLIPYHKFNEHKSIINIINNLKSGDNIALVSDAGTPAISDPGYLIVKACVENDIEVETLPGATAFVPAIVNSGLPNDKFIFEGFLPQKKGRQKLLSQLKESKYTMIFYESPFRLVKTLNQFIEIFGEKRRASVSRELSKIYEENKHGSLKELYEYFSEKTVKGEIVLIVEGKK